MKPYRNAAGPDSEDRISRFAGRLARRKPPRDLWTRIEKRLAAELECSAERDKEANGVRNGVVRLLRAFRLPDGGWSGLRISAAAAAAVLLVVLAVPNLRGPAVSLVKGRPHSGLVEVDREAAEAELGYRKAIERLAVLAGQNEKAIEPGLLALYREKLDLLDGSIRECRRALETNYRNSAAHAALLYCYKQKAETLRMMAGETHS